MPYKINGETSELLGQLPLNEQAHNRGEIKTREVLKITGTVTDHEIPGLIETIREHAQREDIDLLRLDLDCNITRTGLEAVAQVALVERAMIRFFPKNEMDIMFYGFDMNRDTTRDALLHRGSDFTQNVENYYREVIGATSPQQEAFFDNKEEHLQRYKYFNSPPPAAGLKGEIENAVNPREVPRSGFGMSVEKR